jgi:CheY-like chemotaxis protein
MLIDDNEDDNFFHSRVIRKNGLADNVLVMPSAREALEYLKLKDPKRIKPDLILLDINMPGMNGWEFLDAYQGLEKDERSDMIIVMLTTSENPDDRRKSLAFNFVCNFQTKPLTKEKLQEVITENF